MIRYLAIGLSTILLLCGCHKSKIPRTAFIVAEDENVAVYLNKEDTNEIPQVSLWLRYKNGGDEKRLILTHPHSRRDWQTYDSSMVVKTDSIATISRVTIFPYGKEPLKLLVEGCPDYRNVESLIVSVDSDSAIMLPTNEGMIGVSHEDGLLIMETYDYYNGGGRYSKIDAYDLNGKRINSMNAKTSDD